MHVVRVVTAHADTSGDLPSNGATSRGHGTRVPGAPDHSSNGSIDRHDHVRDDTTSRLDVGAGPVGSTTRPGGRDRVGRPTAPRRVRYRPGRCHGPRRGTGRRPRRCLPHRHHRDVDPTTPARGLSGCRWGRRDVAPRGVVAVGPGPLRSRRVAVRCSPAGVDDPGHAPTRAEGLCRPPANRPATRRRDGASWRTGDDPRPDVGRRRECGGPQCAGHGRRQSAVPAAGHPA